MSRATQLDWRTSSLKLLKEMPAAGLFEDLKGSSTWEISGLVIVDKMVCTPLSHPPALCARMRLSKCTITNHSLAQMHMIFDNLHMIGKVEERFQYLKPENMLIEHATEKSDDDSQFESIQYSPREKRLLFLAGPSLTPPSPSPSPFHSRHCFMRLQRRECLPPRWAE